MLKIIKKNPSIYAEDLIKHIISITLYDLNFIKKITSNFKNIVLLKKYIGTSSDNIKNYIFNIKHQKNLDSDIYKIFN